MPFDYKDGFSRNIGLITEADQKAVAASTVGIAGVGADGGLPAERIARLGVKKIKLADPDVFDTSNINRQFGSTVSVAGKNKAVVVAEELRKIQPDLEIEVFSEGITPENVKEFVEGCDIILDEIEYTVPSISVMLHREARKNGIEILVGLTLGFGVNVYRFIPDGIKFEDVIGYKEGQSDKDFDMKSMAPNIPGYVSQEVVQKVLNQEMYIPAVAPSVALLAGLLSFAVLGAITKKWQLPALPKFTHLDMYENKYLIL